MAAKPETPGPASALTVFTEPTMPYALFSNDAN